MITDTTPGGAGKKENNTRFTNGIKLRIMDTVIYHG